MESSLTYGILHGKSICRQRAEILLEVYCQRQFYVNREVAVFCERHGASRRSFSHKNARNSTFLSGSIRSGTSRRTDSQWHLLSNRNHRVSPFALQKLRFFRGAKDDNPETSAIRLTPQPPLAHGALRSGAVKLYRHRPGLRTARINRQPPVDRSGWHHGRVQEELNEAVLWVHRHRHDFDLVRPSSDPLHPD